MNVIDFLSDVRISLGDLERQKENIEKVIEILKLAKEQKHTVFICGNGGSASTATHMACDLLKMSGIRAISLNENPPLLTAIINDDGWDKLYLNQLKTLYRKGDILVTISVHGGSGQDKAEKWSQNLIKAIQYVHVNDGITIGITGFDGGLMKKLCDVCIVVPAYSTPIVESLHVVLHHLIAFTLQEGDRI